MAMTSQSQVHRSGMARFLPHGSQGAALAYTFTLLLLLFPQLTHQVDPMWDAFDLGYPDFTYLADAIREGRLPLWDPYTNCGLPLHANPGGMTLNPVAIAISMLIGSSALGFLWFWGFYWWLGGFGMLWLARHYGASPAGAFVAGISYALSGFFLAHAEHTSFIVVAACFPWILWCAERAVSRNSLGDALLAGTALGFCSYGGYPGLVLFACLSVAVWLTLRFLPASGMPGDDPRPFSTRLRWVVVTLAVMAVVYLAVWSPSLHAFLVEGRGYTDRVDPLPMARATGNEPFTWTAALSLFFPYVTFTGRGWMGCDISMSNAYLGMLTLPLAIYWLWRQGWRRCWWIVGFAVFMFVVSLGGQYGLRTLVYYLYPPTRYMQFNAPFRLFWILPLCLAAGLGFSRLLNYPGECRAALRSLLGWGVAVGGAAVAIGVVSAANGSPVAPEALRLFAPGTAILALGIALLWHWVRREEGGRDNRYLPLLLALVIGADMALHLYNNSGTVWNPQTITKQVEQDHQRSTRVDGPPPPRIPGLPFGYFNAQQVVKVPLVRGYVTMKSAGFDEVLAQSRFSEVLSGPYRFWLSPGIEAMPPEDQALAVLAQIGADQPVPLYLDHLARGHASARVIPGAFGRVEIRRYAPELIEMDVYVPGTSGAFLASTERYAAGWQAFVDGTPQLAQKVNLYFRGVAVPPGEHRVVWRYRPARWVPLVWVSYLSLAGAAVAGGCLIWCRLNRDAGETTR